MLGADYHMDDKLSLRAGLNMARNPVPDTYLNALFPAIVKNHITLGVGYAFNKTSTLDFALSHAPRVSATSGTSGVTTSHTQDNWQLVYGYRY